MQISAPVAALLGACIGAFSSTFGAFLSNYLGTRRDKAKWLLEKKVEAYFNSLRYLTKVLNRRTAITSKGQAILEKSGVSEWLNDLCEAQIWLSSLQIYCSNKNQKILQKSLDRLNGRVHGFMENSINVQPHPLESDTETLSFAELIKSVYKDVYLCARDELSPQQFSVWQKPYAESKNRLSS
jgi:hypothetical protein